MTDRPLLFSAPMVRALLAGEKTVTRRLVTASTSTTDGTPWPWLDFASPRVFVDRFTHDAEGSYQYLHVPRGASTPEGHDATTRHRVYPRIEPRDTLWVRETWGAWPHMGGGVQTGSLRYRATDAPPDDPYGAWTWRPSIFLPRWASRISLRVVSVRAERLQQITPADAFREGIGLRRIDLDLPVECAAAIGKFRELWDSINGKRAPWASNPWVWRIEFKREL